MLKILSIINLIVAVQALFLFLHFSLKSKGIKTLNRLLALLCFSFFFLLVNTYISIGSPELQSILFQDIANNVMWFIGPSLYLYVTHNQKQLSNKQIGLHLVPFIFPALIDIIFNWQFFDDTIPFVAFPQMAIYLILSLLFCLKNYKQEQQFYSWVLPSIIAFIILIIINFSLRLLNDFGFEILPSAILQSFTTLLSFPIFYIAYKEMNTIHAHGIQPKKYKTTPLSQEKSAAYLLKVKTALEKDKLYRDTALKLSTFSSQIGVSPKYISQTINKNLSLSFTEYITQLRIEDAKFQLKNPQKRHLTISAIAEESGFASSSRFNHLFKKHVGLTPSQYQKQ